MAVKKMNKYTLIIFDMDGTLYQFKGSGNNNALFKTAFYEEVTQNAVQFLASQLSCSVESAQKIREDIFVKYNGDISVGLEKEFGLNRMLYFEQTWDIDALCYFKEDTILREMLLGFSCKKAVLTNAPRVWADNALNTLGITNQFERIYSGEGEIRKPQKEAYLLVCEAFGVKPNEVMMVEDELQYLKPAKALGMTTVFVSLTNNVSNKCFDDSSNESYVDYAIASIYDLEKIVRRE